MTIKVSRTVLGQMRQLAGSAHPNECCGLLMGQTGIIEALIPADNVHPRPDRHFEIDPQCLIDAHRNARIDAQNAPNAPNAPKAHHILGYYHSHPDGPAHPSKTDREMAHNDGMIWAILGADEVLFWHDLAEGFVPLSYSAI